MSEQKMREAFEVWWRAVLNDPYKEVGIDDKHIARLAWNAALAQQASAAVPEGFVLVPIATVLDAAAALIKSVGDHADDLGKRLAAPPAAPVPEKSELDRYDIGHINCFGGGDVEWWLDYIRCEIDRAHDFYQSQVN